MRGNPGNSKPDSVMGRIRKMVADDPNVTNAQLFEALSREFSTVNPSWLRHRVCSDHFQILKRRHAAEAKRLNLEINYRNSL